MGIQLNFSTLSRRNFLSFLATGTCTFLTKDLLYPALAMADSEELANSSYIQEKYHIFVPYTTARMGGKESLNLRSGESYSIKIPSRIQENQEITIKGGGQNSTDITVVLHTLYDRESRIAALIYQEFDRNTQFLTRVSQDKCKAVYEQIENGDYINDLTALDLLDYIMVSSQLASQIQERYKIASTNSRLIGIQQVIESTLAESNLTKTEKKQLVGTYACVRASEPVPDFKALVDLDSIIANSALPLEIKQTYTLASAKSRALTVDIILSELINDSQQLSPEAKENYLSIYKQVSDGKTVADKEKLKSLDSFIDQSNIPENAKVVYLIASRQQALGNEADLAERVDYLLSTTDEIKDQLKDAKKGAAIVPQATKLLSAVGAETATGVSISSLSGAAATNATLAFLGGGSVAAGGLGMLGGLAVATGGSALIGAAGMLSIALVSEMDNQDRKNLGIAVGTGTITGAATVLAAWTAGSALGVTGTLSGAAAITATISALGGLSVMTGGSALIASATTFVVWSFLKGGKKREQFMLHQLEARTYTLTENPQLGSLGEFIQKRVPSHYHSDECFSAPDIPLDKLSNALSTWLSINPEEKIIALIDTSLWNDAKAGAVFTDRRLIWKEIGLESHSIEYKDLAILLNKELAKSIFDEKLKKDLSNLLEVMEIISDEDDKADWVKLLQEIGQRYSTDGAKVS